MAIEKTDSKSTTTKKASPDQLKKEIEKRAYEISLDRRNKGLIGDENSDWIQAESEMKKKNGTK